MPHSEFHEHFEVEIKISTAKKGFFLDKNNMDDTK